MTAAVREVLQYVLDGHTPVREDDPLVWAKWLKETNRHVAFDYIEPSRGRACGYVTTIFIGLDLRGAYEPTELPPMLFETMAFAPSADECSVKGLAIAEMHRYETWDQAEAGHARVLEKVRRERV